MNRISLHRSYCEEHSARDHWIDEYYKCHGKDLTDLTANGWTYHRHIGGGWFEYRETIPDPLPLDWQTLADAHANRDELEIDY